MSTITRIVIEHFDPRQQLGAHCCSESRTASTHKYPYLSLNDTLTLNGSIDDLLASYDCSQDSSPACAE